MDHFDSGCRRTPVGRAVNLTAEVPIFGRFAAHDKQRVEHLGTHAPMIGQAPGENGRPLVTQADLDKIGRLQPPGERSAPATMHRPVEIGQRLGPGEPAGKIRIGFTMDFVWP